MTDPETDKWVEEFGEDRRECVEFAIHVASESTWEYANEQGRREYLKTVISIFERF